MHVIAAKAVCFGEALKDEFKEYAQQVVKNAAVLCQELKEFGFDIVSGGTDNHLMLIDLTSKNITGKDAEKLLDTIGITVNKNTIPNEKLSPFVTSGVRVGTAAVTTRGMKEEDMKKIAYFINYAIEHREEDLTDIKAQVSEFTSKFKLYK